MTPSALKKFLESPLAEAIASDFAIVGGLEAVRALRTKRRGLPINPQQPGVNPAPVTPPPPKDLHKALLKLTAEQIKEVTEWMQSLHYTHKLELSKWELTDLNTLFTLPHETRTQLIKAVTGPTPADQLEKLKKWIGNQILSLNDDSKATLQEWEAWADSILDQESTES